MIQLWATRGYSWGFRFLRDGGLVDPLPRYEEAFLAASDEPEILHGTDNAVALRFPDPEGRTDRAGRIISHDFVLTGPEVNGILSLEDARQLVWDEVKDEYARLWDA